MAMHHYDPQASYLQTSLRLRHTVIPAVLGRGSFWLFFGLHLLIWSLNRIGYVVHLCDVDSETSWQTVQLITHMTTFFEVFCTNNLYLRHVNLYEATQGAFSIVTLFVYDLRVHATEEQLPLARLATRYTLAGLMLYIRDPKDQQECAPQEEWTQLLQLKLLREEEAAEVRDFSRRQASLVLLHWSARAARESINAAGAPSNVLRGSMRKLLELRETLNVIHDTVNLPTPFQYFHMLTVMLMVTLLAWAYKFGNMASAFAPIGFFFTELIFCGLLELSVTTYNPYEVSEHAFPIDQWLSETLVQSQFQGQDMNEEIDRIGCEGIAKMAREGPVLKFEKLD